MSENAVDDGSKKRKRTTTTRAQKTAAAASSPVTIEVNAQLDSVALSFMKPQSTTFVSITITADVAGGHLSPFCCG